MITVGGNTAGRNEVAKITPMAAIIKIMLRTASAFLEGLLPFLLILSSGTAISVLAEFCSASFLGDVAASLALYVLWCDMAVFNLCYS